MFQHTATRRWLQILSPSDRNTSGFQHTATRRWLPQLKCMLYHFLDVSTHSHPKVAASSVLELLNKCSLFQHTATRRWLRHSSPNISFDDLVSTHSHPKVAACRWWCDCYAIRCFNTQPPEGGCDLIFFHKIRLNMFQHTATRRWLQRDTRYQLTNP